MNLRKFITEYLAFSRKERTAIISFLVIILILYLIPIAHSYYSPPVAYQADSGFVAPEAEMAPAGYEKERELFTSSGAPNVLDNKGELFHFDPNQATAPDWLRLGLSEKTALTIDRYRKKGGRFYRKEDLQRIWGLPPGFYERVKDHIVIPPRQGSGYTAYERTEYVPKEKVKRVTNINAADSSAFEALPGIGAKLSARIVGFRKKLGGFYSVDQVGETYGIPDSTFQKIRPLLNVDPSLIQKININTATKDELRTHPYIRWNLANAIIAYRTQHGTFQSVEDLRKIAVIDEKTYEKVYRYLRVE